MIELLHTRGRTFVERQPLRASLTGASLDKLWRHASADLELRQLLLQLQHRGEEVAVLLDPLQHVAGLEDQ